MDVKKNIWGKYEVRIHRGTKQTGRDPTEFAIKMEDAGAGELILCSIDQDGTMKGYDIDLIRRVTAAVHIPLVACGGSRTVQDLVEAVKKGGASAAGAGSMFVFQRPHRAVLISYPPYSELETTFKEQT